MKFDRSIGVHDGAFHADEVTACAFLILFDLIDITKIFRTRVSKILEKCEFVCDVGGIYDPCIKRFDHHQKEYQGKMSSAGMILKYLMDQKIISDDLYNFFNDTLIIGVDDYDNGNVKLKKGYSSFSEVIANFLPIEYDTEEKEKTKSFYIALDFVLSHLDRLQKRYYYRQNCKKTVNEIMKKSEKVLIFDKSISWLESFFELGGEDHSALFVIMPAQNHWKLRGVPPSLSNRMKVRCNLPKEWGGLHEKELEKISKLKGAIFCHKGLFISIWKTKEDAKNALKKVLEINGDKNVNI